MKTWQFWQALGVLLIADPDATNNIVRVVSLTFCISPMVSLRDKVTLLFLSANRCEPYFSHVVSIGGMTVAARLRLCTYFLSPVSALNSQRSQLISVSLNDLAKIVNQM